MHGIVVYVLLAMGAAVFGGAGFLVQSAFGKAKKPLMKLIPSICLFAALVFMVIRPVFILYYYAVSFIFAGIGLRFVFDFFKKESGV